MHGVRTSFHSVDVCGRFGKKACGRSTGRRRGRFLHYAYYYARVKQGGMLACDADQPAPLRCNASLCARLHDWLGRGTRSWSDDHFSTSRRCNGAARPPVGINASAALLLRGRWSGSWLDSVLDNYIAQVVCPLRKQGYHTESFVTAYSTLPPSAVRLLRPRLVHVLPAQNSSQLLSIMASVVEFDAFRQRWQGPPFQFVLLSRLDLHLKQPISTYLPSLAAGSAAGSNGFSGASGESGASGASGASGVNGRFLFAFRESWSVWRAIRHSSVCTLWEQTHRVADTMYIFDARLTTCVVRALVHYLLSPIMPARQLWSQLTRSNSTMYRPSLDQLHFFCTLLSHPSAHARAHPSRA